MKHIIDNDQLSTVTENVRAGIVSMDGTNHDHVRLFRKHGPALYERLASTHGTVFPAENIERIINAVANSEVMLRFIYVAKEVCKEPILAGIMTSVQTYDVRWNKQGKRQVFPLEHGEDLILDEKVARWFRHATKTGDNPKGIGLGSFIISEQINQAVNDPDFRGIAKDNEFSLDNLAVQGAMRKNGAVIGTKKDSLVFQVRPDEVEINDSFGLKIDIEYPHAQGNFFARDKNSVIAHWVSADGTQQLSMAFTKIPATSDPEPVVWTRITNNGNLPDEKTLSLVLRSMLKAGIKEIESPNRLWMIPPGHENNLEFYKAFGSVSPNFHLHTFQNKRIVKALEKIGEPRYFGDELMISGQIDYAGAIARNGKAPFKPTVVQCTGEDAGNDPIFDFMSTPAEVARKMHSCPSKPVADNSHIPQSLLRIP